MWISINRYCMISILPVIKKNLRLTYTHCVHTVPCPLSCTLSYIRSLESIAAITSEQHNRVDHVITALLAAMIWLIQKAAVYFCKNGHCYSAAV